VDIQLDLALDGADAEELEAATRDLQRELGELVDVSLPDAEPAPAGTRAVEVDALGSLVMKVDSAAVGPVARRPGGDLDRRPGGGRCGVIGFRARSQP
jgi:hypothetical protein